MTLTRQMLDQITGNERYISRKEGFAAIMRQYAASDMKPHRMAQLLAQILHESAAFRHVREVWGPTTAQRRYEGRKDLGNVKPGDGKRFMGRDLIQITGRANYRSLTKWAREHLDSTAPDFEANPELLEAHEWLGIGVLWYWTNRVPRRFVDAGNIEMVTRRVNGGLNGFADRLRWYDRAALVFLGRNPDDISGFQDSADIKVDGISGPQTRAAMHRALEAIDEDQPASFVPILPPDIEPIAPPAQEIPPSPWAALFAAIARIFGGKT